MKQKAKPLREKLFIIGMLAIPVLHFLVFWVYVNFNSILMAFQRNGIDGQPYWTFFWFQTLWGELFTKGSTLLTALKNTMIYFGCNILVVLPVSLLLCYFLYKRIRGYKIFRVIFYLPSIISASIMVVLFKYIIAIDGPLGILIAKVFKGEYPQLLADSRYAMKTIVFYVISFGLGGNIVLLSGAMGHIDESIIEAGRIDGVNMFTEITRIVIPLVWPTLSTLILFAFVGLFGASGPILLFTEGDWGTTTISYWIYERVYFGQTYNYPAAIGLVFTLIGAPITLTLRHFMNKNEVEV